jgi:hypothetical protein
MRSFTSSRCAASATLRQNIEKKPFTLYLPESMRFFAFNALFALFFCLASTVHLTASTRAFCHIAVSDSLVRSGTTTTIETPQSVSEPALPVTGAPTSPIADIVPDSTNSERPVLFAPLPPTQAPERPYRYTFDGSPVRKTTQIDLTKALIFGGGYTAAIGAAQYYQYQAFWSDRLSFRIIDDGDLELGADKAGHMFAGYFMSKFSTDVLLTAGVGEDIATIGGGLMGLGYQFFVEIQDGYGKGWGFSPSDMVANTIGAGLHIAQRYVPGVKYVKMKADFYPAPWIGEKTRKNASSPIDDYSAWTWWLSLDVHGILPEAAKPYWPSWLNLAFGYASRSLEWEQQSRRYIISLDYDLEKLLPDGAPLWNWFKQYLNILKLPAPAIEFGVLDDGKGNVRPMPVRAYVIFPFKLPF